MDKDYFMNGGTPPPQFETSMPIPWSGLNDQSFFNPTSSMNQYSNFESTWMSTPPSSDTFALRELIGKLGNSTAFPPPTASPKCRTPLTSPELNLPILDQISIPNLGNSMPLTPPLPSLSADPGFAERAAKFSCFGSRSFNGRRTAQFGRRSSTPLMNDGKLQRVSSSPSLKQDGSPLGNEDVAHQQMEISAVKFLGSGDNSNEESSVSEQIPTAETASKTSNEMTSRKRKAISRGKTKEDRLNSSKGDDDDDDDGNAKRSKAAESSKIEDESEKHKTDQKPPEPPKDYIHVRARRGQATDSHSLAERVRREKISERMKLLQDLVPGCNKVTGKALMLDEIINYVQSLQRQVEFLSMKLASVNPGLDFNSENLLSKDMFQQNTTLPQQMYPLDSSGPAFFHHQSQQTVPLSHNPVDPHPFDAPSCRNLGIHLPCMDGFNENLHQFPAFSEDDLNSIVQMGFAQNPITFPVQNQTSNMKVEL
ncbi:hypothetical protein ACS0TY_020528 [Phlomoides rotata]